MNVIILVNPQLPIKKKKLLKAATITTKKTPKFKRTRDKVYSPAQPITV